MRFRSPAAGLAGLLAFVSPAFAQSGHDHKHDHGHRHDHGNPAVHKAEPRVVPKTHDHAHGVETEGLFGFARGSDIGHKGDRHLTIFYDTHFGKSGGAFRTQKPKLELGYNPTDRLHVALEVWGEHFKFRDVPGFDDQNRWGWGGAIEFKVQLAKRGQGSPVGATLVVAPHYSNSEHHTGEAGTHYALELALLTDVELVKDKVFAAFNLLYEPERVRARGETEWEKESLFGATAAVMARLAPAVFVGGEVQYFRKYEGYLFDEFHGHALYVGPVLTVQTGAHSSFTLAWAAQVAGGVAGEPGNLDLEHFDRHRVRAKWSTHF